MENINIQKKINKNITNDIINTKKKIRIILPGGGCKGSFQLGVLSKIIESKKYEIDAVYGCSIGAILSLHVANENIEPLIKEFGKINNIDDIVKKRKIFNIIKFPEFLSKIYGFFKLGAYKNFKIVDKVLDTLSNKQLDLAKQKCHVVAYDLLNSKETWFSGEELITGVRCSSALWLAVPPVQYKNTLFSDGGAVQLFPVDYIIQHHFDTNFDGEYLFIDCDTRIPKKNKHPKNGFELLSYFHYDSYSRLSELELDKLKLITSAKMHIIRPDKNILKNTLDISQDRMRQTFLSGVVKGHLFLIDQEELIKYKVI